MEFIEMDEDTAINAVKDLSVDEFRAFLEGLETGDIKIYEHLMTLQRNLYWKAQQLEKIRVLTHWLVNLAGRHPDGTPRQQSSALYNLASFTCPWWSDSLEISSPLAEEGFGAAKKLVHIREKYSFETIKRAGGYWIFACHFLYTKRDYDRAVQYFTQSGNLAKEVPDDKLSYLLVGNSIEGIGRAKLLLKKEMEGTQLIRDAIEIYIQHEDDYSKGEAEVFLKQYQPA